MKVEVMFVRTHVRLNEVDQRPSDARAHHDASVERARRLLRKDGHAIKATGEREWALNPEYPDIGVFETPIQYVTNQE